MAARRFGADGVRVSTIDGYLRLAEAAGCEPEPPRLELATTPADERAADAVWQRLRLPPGNEVVVLNTGGAYGAAKIWPAEHFAELAKQIVAAKAKAVGARELRSGGAEDCARYCRAQRKSARREPGGLRTAADRTHEGLRPSLANGGVDRQRAAIFGDRFWQAGGDAVWTDRSGRDGDALRSGRRRCRCRSIASRAWSECARWCIIDACAI